MFAKGPIESNDLPGYYLIPEFSKYVISREGVVISIVSGKPIKGHFRRNYIKPMEIGYSVISMIDDNDRHRLLARHRILALIFKYPGDNYHELEVNHKDGCKYNYNLDNLEWTTTKANVQHTHDTGLISRFKVPHPISTRNIDTGEVTKYPNINVCARMLGLSIDAVKYRYHLDESRVFPERLQYRNSHSDDPWDVPKDMEKAILKYGNAKGILIRYANTGEVLKFDRSMDLAKHLDLAPATITEYVNRVGQPVLMPGFIQIKFASDDTLWREVDEDLYLELVKSGFCIVRRFNPQTKQEKMYTSAIECARDNRLLPTTLNWRLKSDVDTVYSDGCTYNYYYPELQNRVPLVSNG
jgi:hypothetical protein